MAMLRFYFDKLVPQHKKYFLDIVEHLETNSRIVHSPAFENGVVKIQNGDESKLTPEGKKLYPYFFRQMKLLMIQKK